MSPSPEALQAVREAGEHLDRAHEALATAKRTWEPGRPAGGCPCGSPDLRDALEATADAIRNLQAILLPVPGERG